MLNKLVVAPLVMFLALAASVASAQAACSVPFTLTNGTPADATQVMSNFNSLASCAVSAASPTFTGTVGITGNLGITGTLGVTGGITGNLGIAGNLSAMGNVGIGVSTATLGHLQVQGTGDQYISINSTNSGDSGLYFFTNGSSKWRMYVNPPGGHTFGILDAPQTSGVLLTQGATSWSAASDARLKADISTFKVLDRLSGFRAVSFRWRANQRPDIGVVAQELSKTFPEVVTKGSEGSLNGFKLDQPGIWSVDYAKLAPIALEGVKELQDRFKDLQASNERQSAEIRALKEEISDIQRSLRVQTAQNAAFRPQ